LECGLTDVDNTGAHAELVDKETIKNVTGAFPRLKWSGCFTQTIRDEIAQKPWAHTTVIDKFEEHVLGNTVMEPYE
jgi:cyanamide hydratase